MTNEEISLADMGRFLWAWWPTTAIWDWGMQTSLPCLLARLEA